MFICVNFIIFAVEPARILNMNTFFVSILKIFYSWSKSPDFNFLTGRSSMQEYAITKYQIFLIFVFCMNQFSSAGILQFSQPRGMQQNSFYLQISSSDPSSEIIYTTDGSTPIPNHSMIYKEPFSIAETTLIRARTVTAGIPENPVYTMSYLFPNDIIRQNNRPAGYPVQWGPYTAITGNATADYEMDQDLLSNSTYAGSVVKTLKECPSVSIVTDIPNLFSPVIDSLNGGIYMYTGAPITNYTYAEGRGWERPASVEFFENDTSFQLDCGIRIQGGHSRRPEKNPKHSFLLDFDSQYGQSKLNFPYFGKSNPLKFDKLILKSGFGYTWIHQDNLQRMKASYQEDIWAKDTQLEMGHLAAHSRYVHLFLNGMYWGMYIASERMDKNFAESYLKGDESEFDIIKDYAEVSDGNIDAWNKMMKLANDGLTDPADYLAILGKNADGSPNYQQESLVDPISLADYMILNFYGGNTDWDHHNWVAVRNRVNPGKGFQFICWDAEILFASLTTNIVNENNANCPSRVFQQMMLNPTYKRLFADRIQKHFFGKGLLTPAAISQRWQIRKDQVNEPLLAEAARWGDYRRDVHRYLSGGPFALYTRDDQWMSRQKFVQETIFPARGNQFLTQLKAAGMFPEVDAPTLYINEQENYPEFLDITARVSMSVSQGTIYYTLDGTDPVDWSTATLYQNSAIQYKSAFALGHSGLLVARTFLNGQWSAALRVPLKISADYHSVQITEIHYSPQSELGTDPGDFEFLELKNTSSHVLDLSDMYFDSGITYKFPQEVYLNPGQFQVISSQSNSFLSKYHFRPDDTYAGHLNNSGENIRLISPAGDVLEDFNYGMGTGWPVEAKGQGYSLVPKDLKAMEEKSDPAYWRASFSMGGSPGADDQNTLTSTPSLPSSVKTSFVRNYPNPFRDLTYIDLNLSTSMTARISVYDLNGKWITSLFKGHLESGLHQISWNACNDQHESLSSGMYILRVDASDANSTIQLNTKMIIKQD